MPWSQPGPGPACPPPSSGRRWIRGSCGLFSPAWHTVRRRGRSHGTCCVTAIECALRPPGNGTGQGEGVVSMSTTAWRFRGTEGADHAVLRLKQLNSQDLIDVQDVAVIRWPQYADAPTAQEHVTAEGSKVSSLMNKLRKGSIDSSMLVGQDGPDAGEFGTCAAQLRRRDRHG